MNPAVRNLLSEYRIRKPEIKRRLKEFRSVLRGKDEDIFSELCFCLLTPQSKAVSCDRAVKGLKKFNLLLEGCVRGIRKRLKGNVRFHNKKAEYIVAARRYLSSGDSLEIRQRIDTGDVLGTREWLVNNIKGLGYKEASHFLRNIGLGRDIAILDRHILKNLKRCGVISKVPNSIGTRSAYMKIENKMRRFSRMVEIPMDELDLLFWSLQTGFIFK